MAALHTRRSHLAVTLAQATTALEQAQWAMDADTVGLLTARPAAEAALAEAITATQRWRSAYVPFTAKIALDLPASLGEAIDTFGAVVEEEHPLTAFHDYQDHEPAGEPVYVLGQVGSTGGWGAGPGLWNGDCPLLSTVSWIWSAANAHIQAAVNVPHTFYKRLELINPRTVTVRCVICCVLFWSPVCEYVC